MSLKTRHVTALGMIAVWFAGGAARAQEKPADPAQPATLDERVDKILTRLENRRIHDLRAAVRWHSIGPLDEPQDAILKLGRIWYKEFDPVPKFRADFDTRISGGRRRPWVEQHAFDGRWYVEVQEETRTFTKREIRRADDPLNPYKLGEGPFPLPFGQKKADILREFEVEPFDAARHKAGKGDPDQAPPENADHIRLTPRPGTDSFDRYKWVDFWIARDDAKLSGLPVQVRAAKKDPAGRLNTYLTISFSEIEPDTGFAANVFDLKKPAGYHEEVEHLPATP